MGNIDTTIARLPWPTARYEQATITGRGKRRTTATLDVGGTIEVAVDDDAQLEPGEKVLVSSDRFGPGMWAVECVWFGETFIACAVPSCSGTWILIRTEERGLMDGNGLDVFELDENGDPPADRMCDACREQRGLEPRDKKHAVSPEGLANAVELAIARAGRRSVRALLHAIGMPETSDASDVIDAVAELRSALGLGPQAQLSEIVAAANDTMESWSWVQRQRADVCKALGLAEGASFAELVHVARSRSAQATARETATKSFSFELRRGREAAVLWPRDITVSELKSLCDRLDGWASMVKAEAEFHQEELARMCREHVDMQFSLVVNDTQEHEQ